MGACADREHFIPLRRCELIDLLCAEPGLTVEDQERFRRFCRLVTAVFHHQFDHRLEELKNDYAPFDPDADTTSLARLSADEKQRRLNALLREFAWLLERAGFKHLTQQEIDQVDRGACEWGSRMYVNFGAFEHLAIFARGDSMNRVVRRHWRRRWREEEYLLPSYRRLVLILKLRKIPGRGRNIDTEKVYLKVFKDIPKADVKMLLPGARVRLTKTDRGKIGLPFVSGMFMVFWKIVATVVTSIAAAFEHLTDLLGILSANPAALFWGITSGAIGYGTRSYFAYQGTRQRYHLALTENLYFQNLDSNAGVLYRLLDDAEEQQCGEVILAYFFLWRHAGAEGWASATLDNHVEVHLERRARLKVDFEIGDAMAHLERMRLVEKVGACYRALAIDRAIAVLDAAWDNSIA
jgi:hypothetical protein